MTLRHLEIFRAVCACESITAAAVQLNMTQPAVSIAIRELESFYQTQLFERMNRRIYITDAGRMLLQYADSISERFEESVDALRGQQTSRRMRLGVNATIGETHLSGILETLKPITAPPELHIIVDNSLAIEQRLLKNEIDLGIIDELSQPGMWAAAELFTESMVIAGAPEIIPESRQIFMRDLARMNLLLREPNSGSRKCVEAVFQRHGYPIIPAVESASTMALLNLAETGVGVAILPRTMFNGPCARRRLRLAELIDDRFERRFYLVHHPQKYLTPVLNAAIEHLKTCESRR